MGMYMGAIEMDHQLPERSHMTLPSGTKLKMPKSITYEVIAMHETSISFGIPSTSPDQFI